MDDKNATTVVFFDMTRAFDLVSHNRLLEKLEKYGHSIRNCRQRTTCRTCNYKHHTLLHNENLITKTAIADSPDSDKESCSSEPVQITSMKVFSPEKQVLLATAQRLLQMEKRFIRKPEFQRKYTDFIDEYQNLDHMEDVSSQEKITHKPYYLPHHAVVNESSLTTKLRVVFDGSAKPEHGTALNDELLIGPALQQDLRDLILRWRTHKICLIADIKQMYRQILISNNDVDYQRILWRRFPLEDVTEKRLLTVTYGTSCAPFLAIRTLKQLALDEKSVYPDCFDIINNDFYMDDLLTGANDEETAVYLLSRITEVLAKGQFLMHKWASNSSMILAQIPDKDKVANECIDITIENTIEALGIKWNSRLDVFDVTDTVKPFTKCCLISLESLTP
ncbi:uncharacterized protein LOC132904196 [Amyelois transitella]|uniref:uncharacterized protein LOC132904196 n=1 Tax=Amyelois transitella TaxID=680683 RepID=UPI0029906281|nr:uncharacterized protein LOC132904196 [Amyelois transitella]